MPTFSCRFSERRPTDWRAVEVPQDDPVFAAEELVRHDYYAGFCNEALSYRIEVRNPDGSIEAFEVDVLAPQFFAYPV